MKINLVLEKLGKKPADKEDDIEINPNKALGENNVLTLEDQDIEEIVNKGGVATIMTPAGILTKDSKKRGW